MIEVKLNNYVPTELPENMDGWKLDWNEGVMFEAKSFSRDGKVVCTYTLNLHGETTTVVSYDDDKETVLSSQRKGLSQNYGDGTVRLTSGWVSKRYGYFRREKFQKFLDDYNIDNIKKIDEFGFGTTFIVENSSSKQTRLFLPDNSCVRIINGTKMYKYNAMSTVESKRDQVTIATVSDTPYWVFEEKSMLGIRRTLYLHDKNVNIMSLSDKLVSLN